MSIIEEIKEREKAATPGPWCVDYPKLNLDVFDDPKMATIFDGIFMNHARADISLLLRMVDAMADAISMRAKDECGEIGRTPDQVIEHFENEAAKE